MFICDNFSCSKKSFVCVPCENCINSYYCSGLCRQEAFDLYHKHECMNPYLNDVPIFRLLLQAIQKYDSDTLWRIIEDSKKEFNPNEEDFSSENYDLAMLKCLLLFKGCRAEELPADVRFAPGYIIANIARIAHVMRKIRPMLQIENWNLLLELTCLSYKNIFLINRSGMTSFDTYFEENTVSIQIFRDTYILCVHGILSLFNISCKPNICMNVDVNLTTYAKVIRPIAKGQYLLPDKE